MLCILPSVVCIDSFLYITFKLHTYGCFFTVSCCHLCANCFGQAERIISTLAFHSIHVLIHDDAYRVCEMCVCVCVSQALTHTHQVKSVVR